ncbi:MAG: hypothetical protein K0S38_383 [Candidatus Paceibacter sp.]|jgi:cyclopropane fatty-acyl-phospholipid synthase-like methyltransferase|nr:hypothetical protein [Candidatus Paceibacter sp.]
MIPSDHQRILKYYKDALTEYGDHDPRSVHWSSTEGQRKRFRILSQITDLNGSRVLDVGCGLGEFYKFFLENHIDVEYTGIDIIPDFIIQARDRFPAVRFETKDIFETNETYDYVLASGVLTFKVTDNKNFYFSMIKKMYSLAEKGVAFNMLNYETHIDDETYAAYDPNEVADFCRTFCNNVQIVIGYLPQDFTIYLVKESN